MVIGNMLRDREVQYIAIKDDTTQTWRILDTWSEGLKNVDLEDDIDDENPAVKILTEGEFIALMKEAGRIGVLANAAVGSGEAELESELLAKDEVIRDLQVQLSTMQTEVRDVNTTEEYKLKEMAMHSIVKLVSIADMTKISRE